MAEKQDYTREDTLALLSTRASAGAVFVVKISRKRQNTMTVHLPDHIATVGEASVAHIANPELWLPKLVGGGAYMLAIYDSTNTVSQIGGWIHCAFDGDPRNVDMRVVKDRSWQGPPLPIFPDMPATQIDPMLSLVGVPGAPLHTSAPQTSVPGGGLPGSVQGAPIVQYGDPVWIRAEQERLAEREREFLRREARAQAEIAEQKAAIERERMEARWEAKLAAVTAASVKPPDTGFKDLIAPALAFAERLIAGQNENRRIMFEAQQAQAARSEQLMMTLMAKKEMSPESQMLIEVLKTQASSKDNNVEAMSTMTKSAVSMIETIAELRLNDGPGEHPALPMIREAVKAIQAVFKGGPPAGNVRAMPPGQQQPQLPPGQATAAQFEQAARQGAPQVQGVPAQGPVPVQHFPQQNGHANGHVNGAPQAQAAAGGFAGFDEQRPLIDQLKEMVYQKQPVEIVAAAFIEAYQYEELVEAVEEHGGSLQQFAEAHLGVWAMSAPENLVYLQTLLPVVIQKGIEANIFNDGPPGAEDESGEEEAA